MSIVCVLAGQLHVQAVTEAGEALAYLSSKPALPLNKWCHLVVSLNIRVVCSFMYFMYLASLIDDIYLTFSCLVNAMNFLWNDIWLNYGVAVGNQHNVS